MQELSSLCGTIILAAGKDPDHPKAVPLRECMQATLRSLHIQNPIQLTIDNPWGTYDEIHSALYYVRFEQGLHIISSWYHLPRIWLILRELGRKKNVRYHSVWYWNTKRVLKEVIFFSFALFGKFRNPKRKEENFAQPQLREKIS